MSAYPPVCTTGVVRRQPIGSSPLGLAAAVAGLFLVAGCGGGVTDGFFTDNLDDPGPSGPSPEINLEPPAAGQTVAVMEVVIPDASEFTLRGTLPIPKGLFTDSSTTYPLTVKDAEGNSVPTQLEIVSRYPREEDGADVVEVIARVPRPTGAVTGDRMEFEVAAVASGLAVPTPTAQAVAAHLEGTQAIGTGVAALLADQSSVKLRTWDAFGHVYTFTPLKEAHNPKVLRFGPLETTVRTHNVMQPFTPVSGSSGTLEHMFGVHGYSTTLAEEDVLLLDLRIHNGLDGATGSVNDDPQGKLYFEALEISVPVGYSVVQTFEDPGMGTPYTIGSKRYFPLVKPLAGNKLHVMGNQAQTHRRLAIAPNSKVDRARELLDLEGLAFARRGVDSGSGDDYYSWWNPGTARYFPQNFLLPSLEHVGHANLRTALTNEANELIGHLENGTTTGLYPFIAGQLGWAHPFGASYGGMTGGNEIFLFDGIRTVESASVDGIRKVQANHRMAIDRQHNALYHIDGRPTTLADWLAVNGSISYIPMNLFMILLPGSNDPFGYATADPFQVNAVATAGRQPDYEAELLSYDSYDLAHLIRITRLLKTLAWTMNDPMAKDDLQMQAELCAMSYSPHYNSQWGNYVETGMRYDIEYVNSHPGNGFPYGRQEGWAADTMAACYALAEESWRDYYFSWFTDYMDMVSAGQVACSGLIYADINFKILDGNYRGAQAFETSICDNAMWGIKETVFRGENNGYLALTEDVLRDFYDAFISDFAWHPVLDGPARMYATGPLNESLPAYCNPASIPSDGMLFETNTYQTISSLGYGYMLTGDPTFITKAGDIFNGDTFAEAMADGDENVENRAALLAVVQVLNSVL
ncbi:hypothetical protein [Engelhardtia mirabilis]|uniref:Uncharacterized protein n=1 Tax=Engelhardtia mirabilis TaxID=2528011 RepID=A0A518BJG9_9BACT|nr:hypothetical protein Pla133_21980 [Planctomycetes bacterium Pla133]QDV01447.1 hypothetical protein Pla86_21980 [Planctomycetes bacterium Pla86]